MAAKWMIVPAGVLLGVGTESCPDCKHANVSSLEEPCASCSDDCDKWERAAAASEDEELVAGIARALIEADGAEGNEDGVYTDLARAVIAYLEGAP